jgi:hypothetical protein
MIEGVTQEKAHGWLDEYFGRRPDLGLSKFMLHLALEPRNPFAPEVRRKPRAGFVVAAILFASALAWFAWFNLAP